MLFGINLSAIYTVLHDALDSILSCINLSVIPVEDTNYFFKGFMSWFRASRARANPSVGYIGALNGSCSEH